MPVVTATLCGITRSPNVCSVRVCVCVCVCAVLRYSVTS